MAKKPLPSPELLRQLLDYDPDTGILIWKPRKGDGSARWNKLHAGQHAGTINVHLYRAIKIFDQNILAHRAIWAMVHGHWPKQLDHRNGVRFDNRLKNLREASQIVNQRNQKRHCTNTSGRTGVYWASGKKCWLASIKIKNVQTHLGYFDRFEDAVAARVKAERRHGFTGRQ